MCFCIVEDAGVSESLLCVMQRENATCLRCGGMMRENQCLFVVPDCSVCRSNGLRQTECPQIRLCQESFCTVSRLALAVAIWLGDAHTRRYSHGIYAFPRM